MGKTTLVASYLQARKLRALWYQVDGGDADPGTVFHYLARGNQELASPRRSPLPPFTPEALAGLPNFSRQFFERLLTQLKTPAVLVFDNYQEAGTSSVFHTILNSAFEQLPSGIWIFIISREPPPEHLTRLQVVQTLVSLDEEALRFTLQETQAMLALAKPAGQPPLTKQEQETLHRRMQGWAAGLVLSMQIPPKRRMSMGESSKGGDHPSMIFDFLANEVFHKLEPEQQRFLLDTAVLLRFTPTMAAILTGLPNAREIVEQLYRNRCFIERRVQEGEAVYQYHPLFREFLIVQARERLPAAVWERLTHQAGELLEQAGDREAAWDRYRAAGAVKDQIRLLLEQAPVFMEQGRTQTLEHWISQLPVEQQRTDPWLLYWSGCCAFGVRVKETVQSFERAFYGFQTIRNYEGMGLAWAGWVEALVIQWTDGKPFDRLLQLFEDTFPPDYEFQNAHVKSRVVFAQFQAYFWRRPDSDALPRLERQAWAVLDQERHPNILANHCYILTGYYLWIGEHRNFLDLIGHLQELIPEELRTPYCRGMVALMKGYVYWRNGDAEGMFREIDTIERSIRESGLIGGVLTQNRALKVYAHILKQDYEQADQVLQENDAMLTHAPSTVRGFHHHQAGWVAWLQGDVLRAKQEVGLALASAADHGDVFPLGYNHICAAMVYQDLGLLKQAARHLAQGLSIGRRTRSVLIEFIGYTAKAWQMYQQGKDRAGREALRRAMQLGREYHFVETGWFHPKRMAELCVKALESGIEVEYILFLIRTRRLMPETPPVHLPQWPWPIRIRTLGSFNVEVQGQPLAFSRKVQKRILALLKALVSGRSHEVAVDHILDSLWPESEGDHAYNAFTTALHRLRKLLGDEAAVLLQGGKVLLNPQMIWVDAWAFERLLADSSTLGAGGSPQRERERMQQGLHLYQGAFLPDDESEPWTMSKRDRLRRRYVESLEGLAQYWIRAGTPEHALALFDRALEVEPLEEKLYQQFMKNLVQLGRWNEAREVYLRCRRALQRHSGESPSPATEAILEKPMKKNG